MIPRYSHRAVTEQYSAEQTYADWLTIEQATLIAQQNQRHLPEAQDLDDLIARLSNLFARIDLSMVAAVEHIELKTHHDVGAFLQWVRYNVHEGNQWIHFGLTSSDLVDTAQGLRFQRLHRPMLGLLGDVTSALTRFASDSQPVLGLTHGQPAEPTSIGARGWNWLSYVEGPIVQLSALTRRLAICKLSGPVGNYAHNPPSIEAEVAVHLDLIPQGPGANQIVPRSVLAMWASTVATLLSAYSKIATDLRLMSMRDEVYWPRTGEHMGSSAMAHKNNPVECEQIAGFAQMARGFAAMLQQLDLWLERDLSNSSVERVAVPDLWHLLFVASVRMADLLEEATLRPLMAEQHLTEESNAAWTHKVTLDAIRDGMGWQEAREYALAFDTESYDPMGDARKFMENYPAVQR